MHADISGLSAENLELSERFSLFNPVGHSLALHASPAVGNSATLISAFSVRSTAFFLETQKFKSPLLRIKTRQRFLLFFNR